MNHRDLSDDQFEFAGLKRDFDKRVNRKGFRVVEDLSKTAKKIEKEIIHIDL